MPASNGTHLVSSGVPGPPKPELPPVVFIHGASANLKDRIIPLRPVCFEKPGRAVSSTAPVMAGRTRRGRPRHAVRTSGDHRRTDGTPRPRPGDRGRPFFGAAVAAALALDHPERVAGLVLLSAATHPWPGGGTSWSYSLAARPMLGRLFAGTLANPGGTLRIGAASDASSRRIPPRPTMCARRRSRSCSGREPSAPTPSTSRVSSATSPPSPRAIARSRSRRSS